MILSNIISNGIRYVFVHKNLDGMPKTFVSIEPMMKIKHFNFRTSLLNLNVENTTNEFHFLEFHPKIIQGNLVAQHI